MIRDPRPGLSMAELEALAAMRARREEDRDRRRRRRGAVQFYACAVVGAVSLVLGAAYDLSH